MASDGDGEAWDKIVADYNSSTWLKDMLEIPFLEAQFRSFAENQGAGTPWKALDVGCGAGKYTVRLLQAGASHVLAIDVSTNMVEEAKKETENCLLNQNVSGSAEFHVASATKLSSIPGAQQGTFDLAICVYVFCNLLSKDEIKEALAEILKMLKSGGKLMFYETHVMYYMQKSNYEGTSVSMKPKEDGTEWNYYEDEGAPREITMATNSGSEIKFTNRLYTLSSWVSMIVEAGFQVTQLLEPYLDPKKIPIDAPEHVRSKVGKPHQMFWECTKPLLS